MMNEVVDSKILSKIIIKYKMKIFLNFLIFKK